MRHLLLLLVTGWGTGCISDVRRSVERAPQCREYLLQMDHADDGEASCPRPDHRLVVVGEGRAMLCKCEQMTVHILQP